MDMDAIIGSVIIVAALILNAVLVWRSQRMINWISRTGARSAREILKDRRRGR